MNVPRYHFNPSGRYPPPRPEAKNFGRNRRELRLVAGVELVDMIFEHYDQFATEWKRLLPLRPVYVVDREPQSG